MRLEAIRNAEKLWRLLSPTARRREAPNIRTAENLIGYFWIKGWSVYKQW
jgi:hypothetical protein